MNYLGTLSSGASPGHFANADSFGLSCSLASELPRALSPSLARLSKEQCSSGLSRRASLRHEAQNAREGFAAAHAEDNTRRTSLRRERSPLRTATSADEHNSAAMRTGDPAVEGDRRTAALRLVARWGQQCLNAERLCRLEQQEVHRKILFSADGSCAEHGVRQCGACAITADRQRGDTLRSFTWQNWVRSLADARCHAQDPETFGGHAATR